MQQFKIRKDGIREINKKALWRFVPFVLVLIVFIVVINILSSPSPTSGFPEWLIIIPILIIAMSIGIFRGIRRQNAMLRSYTLSITQNAVMREQDNTPPVAMYFSEVREIVKTRSNGFIIKGTEPGAIIIIPEQIEQPAEVEAALNTIRPVQEKSSSFLQKIQGLLAVLGLGLMVCVYTTTNKIIAVASGLLVVAILLWSFFEGRRNRNIDHRTKRGLWWVFLVIASVLANVINRLVSGN